jgi:hypothetical protein
MMPKKWKEQKTYNPKNKKKKEESVKRGASVFWSGLVIWPAAAFSQYLLLLLSFLWRKRIRMHK